MTEPVKTTIVAPRRRRWPRRLAITAGSLLLFLVVGYFVATSSSFFKSVILPRVSKSINAEVTVADASISPFSRVVLRDVKVQPKGFEPIFQARQLVARYSLMDIIRGRMTVHEVTVDTPLITLVQNADGTSNLDPLTKNQKDEPEKPKPSDKDDGPVQLDIRNVSLKNGRILKTVKHADGSKDTVEISNVNLSLDQLKNNGTSQFEIGSDVVILQAPPGEERGTLSANLAGKFNFKLAQNLMPEEIKGSTTFQVKNAEGKLRDLAGMTGLMEADSSMTEIKNMGLRFQQAGKTLGQISVSGPFDAKKQEGKLKIQIVSIDRHVLNLVGAAQGIDFEKTLFEGTTDLTIAQGGKSVAASGTMKGTQVSIKQAGRSTVPVDLQTEYEIAVDQTRNVVAINKLNLGVLQNGQRIVSGAVDRPMTLSLGSSQNLPASTFSLKVNQLNLADWKAFVGDVRSGILTMDSTVAVLADGNLKLDAKTVLQNLSGVLGGSEMSGVGLQATVAALVGKSGDQQNISGRVAIDELAGQFGATAVRDYKAQFDYDLSSSPTLLTIRKAQGAITQQGQPGGNFETTGTYNKEKSIGDFTVKLNDLNQNALAPLIGSALGEKKLVTVSLGGTASARLDKNSAFKADLKLSNLVVRNPAKATDDPPLSAAILLDATKKTESIELAQLQISLSPTDRAKNRLDITGKIETPPQQLMRGNLKIASDGLDVTPFYNLSADEKKPTETKRSSRDAKPSGPVVTNDRPSADSNKEPEPIKLPVQEFALNVDIAAVYLREIAIKNFKAAGKMLGSTVTLGPLDLKLNDAPVKGSVEIDLGVPGYRYNVALNADRVPLEPLANTFIPENRGQYKGEVIAGINLKGQGVTGTSMKQHLTGGMNFSFTNANIQIVNSKWLGVLVPIATVLRISDITESPLNWVDANTEISGGNINLKNLTIVSEAFRGDTQGVIPIANVLTNSPLRGLPVNFQLRRSLAQKANILPSDAPADAKYVKLPDFVKVNGTLGKPKSDINEMALAGLLLRSGSSMVPGKAGSVVEGIGGVLSGQLGNFGGKTNRVGNTNNAAATNSPKNEVLDLIPKLFKK